MTAPALVVQRVLTADPADPVHDFSPQDLYALQLHHLTGWLYRQLPDTHPLRPALRPEYLALSARHALIRREVRDLLAAWNTEQLPALLIKGFALAEFEYSTPAERFYGDVDIVVPHDPAVISRMVHLALARGWHSDGQHADPQRWTHECAHLVSPSRQTKLDVHRFVVGWLAGSQRRHEALTQAVWQRAETTDWDGLMVTRPTPLDRWVVNVAFGRCWGGDAGGLKPADYTDSQQLQHRYHLSLPAARARAAELGGAATWAAFEAACNPQRRHFAFEEAATEASLLRAITHDGYSPSVARWRVRLALLPQRLIWMLRVLPDVLAAALAWKRSADPRLPLQRWTMSTPQGLPDQDSSAIMGAINWWTRLLYPRQRRLGVCIPRAYATYRALQRRGHPVFFVSGVARTPHGITGHAWIEEESGVPDWYQEPLARLRFTEQFRWPKA